MRTYLDAKLMAKALRQALAARSVTLTHSECLEIVARQFGFAEWNMLAARIDTASTDNLPLVLPLNWRMSRQTNQRYYRAGLSPDDSGVALVESLSGYGDAMPDDSFGCLMQSIVADDFKNCRVKLSASLRTEGVDSASIWIRVDRLPGTVLRFDNLRQRAGKDGPLRGDCGWTERSIIVDVPDYALSIHYGILLQGHGRVWARAFRLETVGLDVPATAGNGRYLAAPSNLDFLTASQS
ncbi:hypothetical protein FJU30_05235 [Affinibrenneria salicis]|uniref:Glyoxalase-related protein domain-containing protein n=1 Tax=Affinibrenneria salicis TaxID=2590031 RepID=A0A5J5G3L5_9GAMM|nr:glyoxalase superfamily protein [Affinibrenneria salicis]KAA9001699.1 hypothetical protein FJU30_05235 [Affinibrenneria salicis]